MRCGGGRSAGLRRPAGKDFRRRREPSIQAQVLAPRILPNSTARTLHPSLEIGGGPVSRRPACEKELYNIGLSLSYSAGRYAFFQPTAGFAFVVRMFVVLVGHLRSLSGLLKNDYQLDVPIPNRLKFLINDPKTTISRKERFFLVKIGRQPPNCSRT